MLRPKKAFGQNFLVDKKVVQALVGSVGITPEDAVLEVGAGTGVVTSALADGAGQVLAVEIDTELIPILKQTVAAFPNVTVVNQDVLQLDFNQLVRKPNFKIVGSIPYQITSPLIHKLLATPNWPAASLLMQKEVAEKLTATAPHATYLGNLIAPWLTVKKVTNVPKTAFRPQPKVDGAIVRLERRADPPNLVLSEWEAFLHRGFNHPRQMLRKTFPADALASSGISPTARPQELMTADWQRLQKSVVASAKLEAL